MNPGDTVSVHIFDPPAPGGGHALEVTIDDLTTGQRGFMQASADNGFAQTSYADCSSKPFNYEPEYSTAAVDNYISWAGLRTNIGTAVELGHFTPCASVTDPFPFFLAPGVTDTVWGSCTGPYEDTAPGADGSGQVEPSDAPCYPAGDTHPVIPGNHDPDEVTGCADAFFQNGDLDYDGSPYWPEWPTGTSPTALYPSSFTQSPPTSHGHPFDQFFIQSNVAAGESTCPPPGTSASGCAIPPPTAPGAFYPYWSEAQHKGTCAIEFGNITGAPGVTDFGKATQYGTNQVAKLGYPIFQGALMSDDCPPR
jgi:hypothetical protein